MNFAAMLARIRRASHRLENYLGLTPPVGCEIRTTLRARRTVGVPLSSVIAGCTTVFGVFANVMFVGSDLSAEIKWGVVWIFYAVVAVAVAGWCAYDFRTRPRFPGARLELTSMPGLIAGEIRTTRKVRAPKGFSVQLCRYETKPTSRPGAYYFSREVPSYDRHLWSQTQILHDSGPADSTVIPVRFEYPINIRTSGRRPHPSGWKLKMTLEGTGGDAGVYFDIPVADIFDKQSWDDADEAARSRI